MEITFTKGNDDDETRQCDDIKSKLSTSSYNYKNN